MKISLDLPNLTITPEGLNGGNVAGVMGDGVTDDTLAIQSALTSQNTVILGPGTYLISNQLAVPSNRYVRLLPGATLLRRAGTGQQNSTTFTNANFFVNSDVVNGNSNITIEGGTYDGNQANQPTMNFGTNTGNLFGGVQMRFCNMTHLRLKSLVLVNGITVQIQVGNIVDFIIEDIKIVYTGTAVHKETLHVNGPASLGVIRDIQDNGGNDCIVAINANDDTFGLMSTGDIQYILVENLVRTGLGVLPYVGSAIMFLNSNFNIRDVTVRGIRGPGFQATSVVLFRAYEGTPTGIIDRIIIEDCDVSTPTINGGFCDCNLNIGSISFINCRWTVGTLPADATGMVQCFFVQQGGTIGNLTFKGTEIIGHSDPQYAPFLFQGTVGNLTVSDTLYTRATGSPAQVALVDLNGAGIPSHVTNLLVNGVTATNLTAVVNGAPSGVKTVAGVCVNPAVAS